MLTGAVGFTGPILARWLSPSLLAKPLLVWSTVLETLAQRRRSSRSNVRASQIRVSDALPRDLPWIAEPRSKLTIESLLLARTLITK
jgi:hypothetical protein